MKLWPFARKPAQPVRFVVATKRENRSVRNRQDATTASLRAFVDRQRATEAAKGRA